jgi:tetratricopeptide (TPR) repeat protein
MIREEEPPRPSLRLSSTDTLPSLAVYRHTEPAKLKKLVRGELDWIVMKALEKDRTRRYETASGLARDIQRYLDDEVVEARPPSAGYRFRKFVRRHKAQVIAAGLVLLALLAGIAGTTWGLFREARAKTRLAESLGREREANADLSAANAKVKERYDLAVDAIKTFHTGVSEDFLFKEENFKDLRNRLLKSAQDFYGKLSTLLGKETDLGSRRALAESNYELAELTRKVGRAEAALAAHRAVLAAREALAAEPGANAQTKADVGRSLTEVASLLRSTGQADAAMVTYRRAESLLTALGGSDPAARAALADCRTQMALLLRYESKHAEALAACRLARSDQEVLAGAQGATDDSLRKLAETTDMIGYLLWVSGQWEEAVPELRTAMAIYQKLADEDPGNVEFRRGLAGSHFYLGNVLPMTGKTAEGEIEFRTSLKIDQNLVDMNPAVKGFRRSLGLTRAYFSVLLLEMGKPAEAEAECRKALALSQSLVDEDPTVADFRGVLADCHLGLGIVLLQAGKRAEADDECRRARDLNAKLAAENPSAKFSEWRLAEALGDIVRAFGRAPEAEACYAQAVGIREQLLKEEPTHAWYRYDLAKSSWRRGLALVELGDVAGAAVVARRGLKVSDGLLSRSGLHILEPACCHAVLAGLAGRAGSGVSAAEGEAAAARAMESLRQAIANGFRNANVLRIESALDPLRDRADFKALVAELEKNAPGRQ